MRRKSLDPVLRSARVRSWRAFIETATLVEVGRTAETLTVTPMKPMRMPHGAFEPNLTEAEELLAPSPEELGRAILRALTEDIPAQTE